MPKLPTLDSQTQVTRPLQVQRIGASVNQNTLLGTTAANLGIAAQGTRELADTAFRVQEQRDFDAITKAGIAYQNAENELVNDIQQRTGENAALSLERARLWFDTKGEGAFGDEDVLPQTRVFREVLEGLTDRQREEFEKKRQLKGPALLNTAANHQADQAAKVQEAQYKAIIASSIESASSALNPATLVQVEDEIRRETARIAENQGWPQEMRSFQVQKNLDAMHQGVLNGLLDRRNTSGAKKYFDARKGDMFQATQAKFERLVNEQNLLGKSQQVTDIIMAQVAGDRNQLAEARKIKDPELRKEVVDMVTSRQQENVALVTRERNQASQDIGNLIEAGDVKSKADIPHRLWATISDKQRDYFAEKIKNNGKPPEVETDLGVKQALWEQMKADPQEFSAVDIEGEHGLELSRKDQETFMLKQAEIRAAGPAEIKTLTTKANIIDSQLGLLDGKGSEEMKDLIRSEINDREIAWAQAHPGQKMPISDFNQMVKDVKRDNLGKLNAHFIELKNKRDREKQQKLFAKGPFTIKQRVRQAFDSRELGTKTPEEKKKLSLVERAVNEGITKFKAINDREPASFEQDRIIDRVMSDEVQIPGFFPFTTKTILQAELTEENFPEAFVEVDGEKVMLTTIRAIQPEVSKKVIDSLTKLGAPVTVKNFAGAWLANFNGKAEKREFPEPSKDFEGQFLQKWAGASTEKDRNDLEAIAIKTFGPKAARKLVNQAGRQKTSKKNVGAKSVGSFANFSDGELIDALDSFGGDKKGRLWKELTDEMTLRGLNEG